MFSSNLKHHMYGWSKFDSLAVSQTEHLVVIQHRVHVLNPKSVNWPVADHPLVVVTGVADCITDTQRHQSVTPLQR